MDQNRLTADDNKKHKKSPVCKALISCILYFSEASFSVQAKAIKDHCNIYDPNTLTFKEGDIIKVSSSTELLIIESFSVQAKAIKDHCNIYDPNTLTFKEGDIIKVSCSTELLIIESYSV